MSNKPSLEPSTNPQQGGKGGECICTDPISEIWAYYKTKIQPGAKVCPDKKIAARLKVFSVDEIKIAIDHFAADYWYRENQSHRGADLLFRSNEKLEEFLNLRPRRKTEGKDREKELRTRYVYMN